METVEKVLEGLNAPQREAVLHREGPMLVLAGAGSGKTRVVTRRVAYLIATGAKPWEVLALTFTNKAAGEMRGRVEQLAGESRVLMSTFHSFCARMLRHYAPLMGYTSSYTIYDTDDRQKLIKDILGKLELDPKQWKPTAVEAAISLAKNELVTPEEYGERNTDFFGSNVAAIYARYEEQLKTNNAMDFDDLLMVMVRLLRDHDEVRRELGERFRYVLVDEYQDTNQAQYRIVRALTKERRNLHVTGDPDQSIYGWRGADIDNILNFERDFPDAKVVRMEQNYRSSQVILDAAHGVIRNNVLRKEKELWSDRKEGARIVVEELEDEQAEADWAAQTIRDLVRKGRKANEIAVFYRVNALSRGLEGALLHYKVPYDIVAGTAFYERKEIRDALAYVKALVNPSDDVSVARIINAPTRGISKQTQDALRGFADEGRLSLYEACRRVGEVAGPTDRAKAAVTAFIEMMDELRGYLDGGADAFLKLVLERTGYLGSLTGDAKEEERKANVEELVNAAGQMMAEQPEATIAEFVEQAALASDVDALDEEKPAVSLMTLHTAKGLEFPVVFIVGMEEGFLPHSLSRDGDRQLEEERRLCFVGMTRAKDELYLSHVRSRFQYGVRQPALRSRFLGEIPRKCLAGETPAGMKVIRQVSGPRTEGMSLEEGDRVLHRVYGLGKVEGVSGSGPRARVKVKFSGGQVKTFVLEHAGFTKLS